MIFLHLGLQNLEKWYELIDGDEFRSLQRCQAMLASITGPSSSCDVILPFAISRSELLDWTISGPIPFGSRKCAGLDVQ
jgi:hypothetical protein